MRHGPRSLRPVRAMKTSRFSSGESRFPVALPKIPARRGLAAGAFRAG